MRCLSRLLDFLTVIGIVATLSVAAANHAQGQATPQQLPTQVIKPQKTRINLKDLPKPNETESVSRRADIVDMPEGGKVGVPKGFVVQVFARNLKEPRTILAFPGGVLVAESKQDRIRLLRDENGDGVADTNIIFADKKNGMNQPFGMAFSDEWFFVANTDSVLRFPYFRGQTRLKGGGEKIATLTGGGYNQHWTRNLQLSNDRDHLYVSVGSASNNDEEKPPRASIFTMALDGRGKRTVATGLRNPVGLGLHPQSGALYTAVNERDGLGDDLVPDYFTSVKEGGFYGWPYSYLSPENLDPKHVKDGKSIRPDLVARTVTPDVLIQAHSAALGLAFYEGEMFPERYRNGAFVALHGSWNHSKGTGYKVIFVPFNGENVPEGGYEDFMTGFMTDSGEPEAWARPVGLTIADDGALLVTDDANGTIFRVSYQKR